MRYLYIGIFLFIVLSAANAEEADFAQPDTGILSIRFKNINFMRDNEYANPITEGYTLFGFLIQPTIVYSPISSLNLSLGVQLLSYAGAAKINSPVLIFSTRYRISGNTAITLGTLDGSDKHLMDDPHFYREKFYTAYTETGLDLLTHNKNIFNDVWVNWENFIHKGDTTREVFNIGESFNYSTASTRHGLSLEVPVQFIVKHFGGQISNYAPEVVETFFNSSAGLKVNYDIGNGLYGRISIEYQEFGFYYKSKYGTFRIKSGNASWLRLHYNYRSLYFGSYYWKGRNYFAPDGNPIYSCASERTYNLIIPERSIWTNSFYYTFHPAKFFEVFAGVDLYYDIGARHLDEALTLHLKFDQMFTLHKFK